MPLRVYESNFPVPPALMAPGGEFEIEARRFRGFDQPMFRHAPRTLNALLREAFEEHRATPDARMIVQDGVVTSFGAFDARTAALAASLRDRLGGAPGAHVAIVMPNRVEVMMAFMAALAIGAVPVMVNSRGAGVEMRRAIEKADCVVVICDVTCLERLEDNGPASLPIILLGDPRTGMLDFAELSAPRPGLALRFAESAPEDPAMMLFSSGTTGFPKAIVHSQGAAAHALTLGFLVNASFDALYEREFGCSAYAGQPDDRPPSVVASPMFHIGGVIPFLRLIVKGQPTILVSKWNAETVLDILEREHVARLSLAPTMIFDLLASPRRELIAKVRFIANGTAALSPELIATIRGELPRCLVINTFGQSEMLERGGSFGGETLMANPDAVGWVLPTNRLRVLGDDGTDARPGEPGEIAIFGAMIMTGYYNDPAATAETIRDGWLMTGDVGRFDEQGLLHLVDRKKNMVIAGGENIYCAEVERVITEHPAVAEAIAFGEPDARLGERLVAVAVPKPGAKVTEQEIKDHCRRELAIYKVPRAVGIRPDPLPRNATGKVAKGEFLASYERPWAVTAA